MSEFSIKQYHSEVEKIIHFGGTKKETAIRNAFYNLLNEYAKQKGLMIVTEVTIKAANGKNVTPDGTLKDMLRQDWGYWESKDESDNIDDEIRKKFEKGYPKENILFEDSQTAVLIQNGLETLRVPMKDSEALHRAITAFIGFERPEVQNFRKAIELFKQDIPKVTETIRGIIIAQEKTNKEFIAASEVFLKLCHDSINPDITNEDVREMIIQHILTEDVFNTIFDENQFHRENNIARELEKVIHTFFSGNTRRVALGAIQHYYQAINAAAASIADHHEKQKFLKVIYETFYKSYNPKAADRLGVVYTPNEIVQFMIKGTDYLLHKHFNKFLEDKGVDILDPATGTGTFMCDMIDYIRKEKLEHKYKYEMFANEVSILPYYISNLNIEYTYSQKMGCYEEFENLCFVDTLDNMGFLFKGKQIDMFSPFSEENSKRIAKQNSKRIAVIIGNPPYNAAQQNFNDNNANRTYKTIDKRIQDSFVKYGTAQNQIVVYDMYLRFLRWAMDRLDDNGVIAFVSNNSFVDGKTLDGFRKVISDEFNFAYVLNLKGNARTSGERRKEEGGNIFHDQIRVGIAIYFFIKKKGETGFKVFYNEIPDFLKSEEKLAFISENSISSLEFDIIRPDKKYNWINITENDFEDYVSLIDKNVKLGRSKKAIFQTFSSGIKSQRDEWVYDRDKENLSRKVNYLIEGYNATLVNSHNENKYAIKWDRELERYLKKGINKNFNKSQIVSCSYRPYTKRYFYFDKHLNGMTYQWFEIYNSQTLNQYIAVNSPGNNKGFFVLGSNTITDLHFTGDSQCIPLYTFDDNGNKIDNISDWGYNQFVKQYGKKDIAKLSIFYYIYAVLHNPQYREKYEFNLNREFPHIPFYKDFKKWSNWGERLMELHTNFENQARYDLLVVTSNDKLNPQTKLKVEKDNGKIVIDENTILSNIPPIVWDYKLAHYSAIEWVLDQYKAGKPKDATILEMFSTYKFSDYKDQVIDLICRVCTVSIETMKIIEQMKNEQN